ncbi:MAG: type B 50S ribosomal protein L31 [Bacteroidota bacterium]|jgi:large subunit ribosomal protein L31|nr:type B 50S ribosomal protein L31 [Bacteroidota bacterium]
MKEGIHPKNYRKVVFKDMSNDYMFICQSTVDTKETIQYEDGNEYPLFKLDISYKSHPFFTGQSMFIDTAGRIDKFKRRYQKKAD